MGKIGSNVDEEKKEQGGREIEWEEGREGRKVRWQEKEGRREKEKDREG